MSRLELNVQEKTESLVKNPGDVNKETLEFFKEYVNNPEPYAPFSSNQNQQSEETIIVSDTQTQPPHKHDT